MIGFSILWCTTPQPDKDVHVYSVHTPDVFLSGSGSRLIYEQISYTYCKLKTFIFFTFLFQKISGRRLLIGLKGPELPPRRPPLADLNRFVSQNYLLLAIFLYLWIRIQRPKNMRIRIQNTDSYALKLKIINRYLVLPWLLDWCIVFRAVSVFSEKTLSVQNHGRIG